MKRLQQVLYILLVMVLVTGSCSGQEAALYQRLKGELPLSTMDGSQVSLKQLAASRATVINFTTTWCADCKKLSEVLERIIPGFQSQGINFIFVYVGQKSPQVQRVLGDTALSESPLRLLDINRTLSESLSITSVPFLFMVDSGGTIRFEGFSLDETVLSREMARLLR
ncbi:MAG: TlpA disulfide reductase family protein [Pseudomonadota bacterium]